MTTPVKEMLATCPADLGEVDREKLTRCIEERIACAEACTACADACLFRRHGRRAHPPVRRRPPHPGTRGTRPGSRTWCGRRRPRARRVVAHQHGAAAHGSTTVHRGPGDRDRRPAARRPRTGAGERLYRWRPDDCHRHYLICRACGQSRPVDSEVVEAWAGRIAADSGFAAVEHTVELTGVCVGCQPTTDEGELPTCPWDPGQEPRGTESTAARAEGDRAHPAGPRRRHRCHDPSARPHRTGLSAPGDGRRRRPHGRAAPPLDPAPTRRRQHQGRPRGRPAHTAPERARPAPLIPPAVRRIPYPINAGCRAPRGCTVLRRGCPRFRPGSPGVARTQVCGGLTCCQAW